MEDIDRLSNIHAVIVPIMVSIVFLTGEISWLLLYFLMFTLTAAVSLISQHFDQDSLGIANSVTLTRLLALLVVIYFGYHLDPLLVSSILLLIHISDKLDGYLARRLNQTSRIGAILDVETDAGYTVILTVIYAITEQLPVWIIGIGLLRYFYVLLLDALQLAHTEHKKQFFSVMMSTIFSVLLAVYWYLDWLFVTYALQIVGLGIVITFARDFSYRLGWTK